MNLKHRIAELEDEVAGLRAGLVLALRDGGERTISGTPRQFFRLVELWVSEQCEDLDRVDQLFPGRQLALAEADLGDIVRATAMDGKTAQLFGLLAALARGPAEEGCEANGQEKPANAGARACGDKKTTAATATGPGRATRQGKTAKKSGRPTARPAWRGGTNKVRSRNRRHNRGTGQRT